MKWFWSISIQDAQEPDFTHLKRFLDKLFHPKREIDIALVGK